MMIRPVFRVAAAGLETRDLRLVEIVFRHSQFNAYQFDLVDAAQADQADIVLANAATAAGLDALARAATSSRRVIALCVVAQGHASDAVHQIPLERLTLRLLPALNRIVEVELHAMAARMADDPFDESAEPDEAALLTRSMMGSIAAEVAEEIASQRRASELDDAQPGPQHRGTQPVDLVAPMVRLGNGRPQDDAGESVAFASATGNDERGAGPDAVVGALAPGESETIGYVAADGDVGGAGVADADDLDADVADADVVDAVDAADAAGPTSMPAVAIMAAAPADAQQAATMHEAERAMESATVPAVDDGSEWAGAPVMSAGVSGPEPAGLPVHDLAPDEADMDAIDVEPVAVEGGSNVAVDVASASADAIDTLAADHGAVRSDDEAVRDSGLETADVADGLTLAADDAHDAPSVPSGSDAFTMAESAVAGTDPTVTEEDAEPSVADLVAGREARGEPSIAELAQIWLARAGLSRESVPPSTAASSPENRVELSTLALGQITAARHAGHGGEMRDESPVADAEDIAEAVADDAAPDVPAGAADPAAHAAADASVDFDWFTYATATMPAPDDRQDTLPAADPVVVAHPESTPGSSVEHHPEERRIDRTADDDGIGGEAGGKTQAAADDERDVAATASAASAISVIDVMARTLPRASIPHAELQIPGASPVLPDAHALRLAAARAGAYAAHDGTARHPWSPGGAALATMGQRDLALPPDLSGTGERHDDGEGSSPAEGSRVSGGAADPSATLAALKTALDTLSEAVQEAVPLWTATTPTSTTPTSAAPGAAAPTVPAGSAAPGQSSARVGSITSAGSIASIAPAALPAPDGATTTGHAGGAEPDAPAQLNVLGGIPGSRLRVLVADTSPAARAQLLRLMEMLDLDAVAVSSIERAQHEWQTRHVDLVITERTLDDGSGFELLRLLRRAPMHQQTPALMLCNRRNLLDSTRASWIGDVDVLAKPVSAPALARQIQMRLQAALSIDALTPAGAHGASGASVAATRTAAVALPPTATTRAPVRTGTGSSMIP